MVGLERFRYFVKLDGSHLKKKCAYSARRLSPVTEAKFRNGGNSSCYGLDEGGRSEKYGRQ